MAARRILPVIILSIVFCFAHAQIYVKKPLKKRPLTTKLGVGLGYSESVVYLTRNVNHRNEASGYNVSLLYGANKFRGAIEYTHYNSLNITPTWKSIDASTLEANLHSMYYFRNRKNFLFAQLGMSYNYFSGYFTGKNDYLNLHSIYESNTTVRSDWVGVNAGVGCEIKLPVFNIFMSYKMRVGRSEGLNDLNIMDICFSAGLRYYVRVPSFYSLYRGTRSRYLLTKPDED